MKINKMGIALSTLLFSMSSFALESDFNQAIHVSSISQHAKMKSNIIVFQDDVLLTQGSIKLTGDKLTVLRGKEPNQEIMIVDGQLATFYQTQDDGKPFDAQANNIHYDVAKSKITLTGNAQVKQLDSQIDAAKIVYFLESEELIVTTENGEKDRVKTVFLPAQFEEKPTETENVTSEKEE